MARQLSRPVIISWPSGRVRSTRYRGTSVPPLASADVRRFAAGRDPIRRGCPDATEQPLRLQHQQPVCKMPNDPQPGGTIDAEAPVTANPEPTIATTNTVASNFLILTSSV